MAEQRWSFKHDDLCPVVGGYDDEPCSCGLSDLLAALEHGPVVLDGEGIRGTLMEAIGEDRALRTLGGEPTYRIVPLPEGPHA